MALLTYLIEYSRFILHDRSVLFMPIFYLYYPTRENYDVFYHGWENYGRGKYGGTSQKPPNFPGHNCTCDFCFAKFFINFKRIYSFLSVPDAFVSTMINDDI